MALITILVPVSTEAQYLVGMPNTDTTYLEIDMESPCESWDTLRVTLCPDEDYLFFDTLVADEGIYHHDSLYNHWTLLVEHAESYEQYDTVVLCQGEIYWHNGIDFEKQASWTDSLLTQQGCDSLVHISLLFYSTEDEDSPCNVVDTVWVTLCPDQEYLFFDTLLSAPGIYHRDSMYTHRTLILQVAESYQQYDTVVLCTGTPYPFRDSIYTEPADFCDSLTTTTGCDSIVYLALQYYDIGFEAVAEVSMDSLHWFDLDTTFESCEPLKLYFRHRSTGQSRISWDFGDGTRSQEENPSHSYSRGLYGVTFVAESPHQCQDTVRSGQVANVFAMPTANFSWTSSQTLVEEQPYLQFINLSVPNDDKSYYLWHFQRRADNANWFDTSTMENPKYSWADNAPSTVGEYQIILESHQHYVGIYGDSTTCSDTASQHITITRDLLQFPNVVTPNGDGINDTWEIVNLVEFGNYPTNHLYIYNRWGRMVYEKEHIRAKADFWDPNIPFCPDGTYFFVFTGSGAFGTIVERGVIEVLRNH